jgi:phosphoribosylformimino-5-aminoimidazole carboxamide ribotide isomerase
MATANIKSVRNNAFRPCIDIHDGKVKQIVGGSLNENGAQTNYTSDNGAAYYANLYKEYNVPGGHIILLNKPGTDEYERSKQEGLAGLAAFPKGLQIGGGVTDKNAREFLEAGASAVIVTSFVFTDGKINDEHLRIISEGTARRLVLDLSVRAKDKRYFIATDRWSKLTDVELSFETMDYLARYACEFLVHAADVEGLREGADGKVLEILSDFTAKRDFPITYAGGIKNAAEAARIARKGLCFTVGSALDIFGGDISFTKLADEYKA